MKPRKPSARISTTSISESKDHWITQFIEAGFPVIPLIGGTKVTYAQDWQYTKPDPTRGPEHFPDNYGIPIPGNVLVIDVDPKSYDQGDDAFTRFKTDLGLTDEDLDTFTVRSRTYADGKEGLHIWFSIPEGLNIRPNTKGYKGIQGLSYGHFVVGPGSIHPDTQKLYTVVRGHCAELKPATQYMIDEYTKSAIRPSGGMDEFTDDEFTRARYRSFLLSRAPAIQGHGGDLWTLKTAMAGYDYNLPKLTTYELMRDCWNPLCVPPWKDKDLLAKVDSAYRSAKDAPGNKHPAADFDQAPPPPEELKAIVQMKKDRHAADKQAKIVWRTRGPGPDLESKETYEAPLSNVLINVVNFFQRPSLGTFHSHFYKMCRFNVFSKDIEFNYPAPWHDPSYPQRFWTDTETIMLRTWFSRVRDWNPSEKMVLDGVISAAQIYKYHPVRDYYVSLTWDGVSRIDTLFTKYAGAADTPYHREIGRRLMIALIARIMEPGCQHDHIVILEGKQGTGKSSFCRILGGDWYTDLHLDPHNKDTVVGLLGKLVVELSEMTYTKRSDVDSVKSFSSKLVDRVRLPYGRMAEDIPRQCVLIATTNRTERYLQDHTGNRRMWPIKTGTFDLEGLAADRDQLFAEAYHLWLNGEPHHIVDKNLIEMAVKEQEQRYDTDIWTECIERWLAREKEQGNTHAYLSTTQIAGEILNLTAQQLNPTVERRIGNTMRSLGWRHAQFREGADRRRGYKNPHYEEDITEIISGV